LDHPEPSEIYRIGTVANVKQMLKLPNGTIRVLVEGLYRAEIIRYIEEDKEYIVEIKELEEVFGDRTEEEALMRSLVKQFEQYLKVMRKICGESFAAVEDIDGAGSLSDMIASHLPFTIKDNQDLSEMVNIKKRLHHLIKLLS